MSTMSAVDIHETAGGRIGPNAIIRVAEALRGLDDGRSVTRIFRTAKLESYLASPPEEMVDEREVARLHRALCEDLGNARARSVSWTAGRLTGDYLLGHRIPKPAQLVLKCLPAGLASRVLVKAITRNAWTFAGSGRFTARAGSPTTFEISGCPICRGRHAETPLCDFYAGTFTRLFSVLVAPTARATEVACEAKGDPACRFEVTW